MHIGRFQRSNVLILAIVCAVVDSPLFAQPVVDHEDVPNASRELRHLLYERYELQQELHALRQETERIEARLRDLDQLVAIQKQMDALARQIETAEEQGNVALANDLEERLTSLEYQLERGRELANLAEQINELAEHVDRFRENEELEGIEKSAGYLRSALNRLRKLRRLKMEQLDVDVDDHDTNVANEVSNLTERIEADAGLIDLVLQLFDALDEDQFRKADDLNSQIQALGRRLDQGLLEPPEQDAVDPSHLPVVVDESSLAKYREADFDEDIVPLLTLHCIECHGNELSSGELNIERMISERPIVANREQWTNVIEQCKNRVMPPEDADSMPEDARTKLVLSLHNAIFGFDYDQVRDPGFEQARRLTHEEYDNTIRDLFGVDLRPAREFPTDLTGQSGFDNSANTLFLQPILMERYMSAADQLVSTLLVSEPQTREQRTACATIFFEHPMPAENGSEVAQRVLQRFLRRAYRRPPSDDELSRMLAQYRSGRSVGLHHREAINGVLRAVLVSPNFLLKSESSPETFDDYRVNDWELASRLSYFLWATMPDETLFQLAAAGELSKPSTLHEQVNRMLDDQKSSSLGTNFAAQWLGSQHLGTRVRMDPIDNPWCTDSLMAAMRAETEMFVHNLIQTNQPIPKLVDADFTFLNNELAKFYKIKGVRGDHMRPVPIETDRRGGIFGHASLLAVTSFPYRTSPVARGKWILDTVLGTPPPPPPPNVSELSEEIAENEHLSIRQKLKLHRTSPSCSACHSQMDPLGLCLENYDWFGRWRDSYGRRRIDNDGTLPNGTSFQGLAGLRAVIVEQRTSHLVRQVTSKLLSYALGRQLEYYDEPAIRMIVEALERDEYRFRTLIHQIVDSYPFQFKRRRRPDEI